MTRTNTGYWQVRFSAVHPDGANYHPSLTPEESRILRDVPKVSVVAGSQNANGFDVQITVDDNGGTADVFSNDAWSWSVDAPVTVVENVT